MWPPFPVGGLKGQPSNSAIRCSPARRSNDHLSMIHKLKVISPPTRNLSATRPVAKQSFPRDHRKISSPLQAALVRRGTNIACISHNIQPACVWNNNSNNSYKNLSVNRFTWVSPKRVGSGLRWGMRKEGEFSTKRLPVQGRCLNQRDYGEHAIQ